MILQKPIQRPKANHERENAKRQKQTKIKHFCKETVLDREDVQTK